MGGGASSCNKKLVDASRRGVIKEMEAAFKKGADPNSKDEHGNTALICAAQRGQAKACELLIQKKAEVDFLNKSDKTAVHYATKDGDKEYNATLKVLLDAGAHADIYDEIRQTPLFYTAWFGNLEMRRRCYWRRGPRWTTRPRKVTHPCTVLPRWASWRFASFLWRKALIQRKRTGRIARLWIAQNT
ncbi:unnamed protein product [Effrenium voratum]|nr:unnamed protein product [Effrenium voratum]